MGGVTPFVMKCYRWVGGVDFSVTELLNDHLLSSSSFMDVPNVIFLYPLRASELMIFCSFDIFVALILW